MTETQLQYICHAGVRIDMDGMSVMVDPYSNIHDGLWTDTPDEPIEQFVYNRPADVLLITHGHKDHFNCDFTLDLMKRYPDMKIVTTQQVQGVLNEAAEAIGYDISGRLFPSERVTSHTDVTMGPLTITLYDTVHDSCPKFEIEHCAFMVRGSKNFLIVGDSVAELSNFERYDLLDTDVLIAPFMYLTLRRGLKVVDTTMQPERIVLNHFPIPEASRQVYYDAAVYQAGKYTAKGIPVDFMIDNYGECLKIE